MQNDSLNNAIVGELIKSHGVNPARPTPAVLALGCLVPHLSDCDYSLNNASLNAASLNVTSLNTASLNNASLNKTV